MEKITKYDRFISSSLDEIDYFNESYSKEDLINLEKYIEYLRNIDKQFANANSSQLTIIKEKCPWINQIFYYYDIVNKHNMLDISTTDSLYTSAIYNNEENKYHGLINESALPKIYLLSKKTQKLLSYEKELDLIQEPLLKMGEVGDELYKDKLYSSSITNNFIFTYRPSVGLYVNMLGVNDISIARIVNFPRKWEEEAYLKAKDNSKIMKRILIKK